MKNIEYELDTAEKFDESQELMNNILQYMLDDSFECMVELEGFREVKAKIIGVNFKNIIWRPVHVEFLEKINKTVDEYEYNNGCWCGDDCRGHKIEVTSLYIDDYVDLKQIKMINK